MQIDRIIGVVANKYNERASKFQPRKREWAIVGETFSIFISNSGLFVPATYGHV